MHKLIAHGSFTIERSYAATPARVFAAFADPALKALWFVGPPGWSLLERSQDFRVGGVEVLHGRFPGDGPETVYTARFHAIETDQHIVYSYDMHLNQQHHSVSLATLQLLAEGSGTRLLYTEQVAFLDGTSNSAGTTSREQGTASLFQQMAASLANR